jgi:citrate synthase
MDACKPILNTGLRGFTVASTKVCSIDGKTGKLVYRGYLVKDIAQKITFEEVAYLLLYEKLPVANELEDFKKMLQKEREIPSGLIQMLKNSSKKALPMDILRTCISMFSHDDHDASDLSREAEMRMGVRLIAKIPLIVAAWDRIRKGKEPVAPLLDLGHAANFLYMMTGNVPDDELVSFFDTALVLHAEHSFNASTFSARQVASTRANMYASVTGAVGSLSGELHGGANTRVMEMLLKIGSVEAVESYVKNILETGGKIMGLGHAVYETDDPRARILEPMSKKMGQRKKDTSWFDLSKHLEIKGKAAFKEKKGTDIYVNVDFYSASLYYYMDIPIDLFTPVFAMARIAGWVAHVIEERFGGAAPKPVLYRPESKYIGDYCGPEECSFVPLQKRQLNQKEN